MGIGIKSIKNISYTDPRFNLYNNLQADAARFAAFREAQKQRELNDAKTDPDKAKVEKRYKEYQLTEKQAIFANSAAAEQWIGFQENADIYPNVTFRTAGDSDVRPSHRALEGLTVSLNDPFLKTHSTPLDFGCRCQWVQTDEPVNHKDEQYKGYKDTPVGKGFDFNPGIDQTLFSDNAGYYTNASNAEAKQLYEQATKFIFHESYNFGRENIGKQVSNKIGKITINEKSRAEWVNQPHEYKLDKNALLENLSFLKNLKFVSKSPYKPNPMVKQEWIAKIKLNGKESVVIVKEMTGGEKILYSISDHPERFEQYFKK